MRAERFLHSQLMCIVDYFLYTTRACCCVGRHRESHSPFYQLVSLKLRISPLLSGVIPSYYSHFQTILSNNSLVNAALTARAGRFRHSPPRVLKIHRRTHNRMSSTLRLIYHSRISRLRTELYFWLGEKVSLNKSDVLIVYHQDYGNDNKQDCD